jgi:hypothetical protein
MQRKYATSSLVTVIALVSLAALAPSCSSSDDSSTSGGAGGTTGGKGGTSGTTAGTGGAGGTSGTTAGTGGATAGTGGATGGTGGATAGTGGTTQGGIAGDDGEAGEGGAPAAIPCGGCAVLTAPLSTLTASAPLPGSLPGTDLLTAQTTFNSTNLTGVTLTIRACVVTGDANSALQMYVQDGAAQSYAGNFGAFFKSFSGISNCSEGMQDLTLAVASAGGFDASAVTSLSVQVLPSGTAGPWIDSTIYVDSITATGDAIGPWNFTSNVSVLALQTSIPGASLSYIP